MEQSGNVRIFFLALLALGLCVACVPGWAASTERVFLAGTICKAPSRLVRTFAAIGQGKNVLVDNPPIKNQELRNEAYRYLLLVPFQHEVRFEAGMDSEAISIRNKGRIGEKNRPGVAYWNRQIIGKVDIAMGEVASNNLSWGSSLIHAGDNEGWLSVYIGHRRLQHAEIVIPNTFMYSWGWIKFTHDRYDNPSPFGIDDSLSIE
jgi:hypothetical protein